jgi:hypothetical protein
MDINLPDLFALAGLIALFLALLGKFEIIGKVVIPPFPLHLRLCCGLGGLLFIGMSIWLYLRPPSSQGEPETTEFHPQHQQASHQIENQNPSQTLSLSPCIGRIPGNLESFPVFPNYNPSGYMGDIGDIKVRKSSEGVTFTYEIGGRGPHEWEYKYLDNGELNANPCQFAGVMYLHPANNFGQVPSFDLRAFRRAVSWQARSLTGEVVVEFLIGGINWIWDNENRIKIKPRCPDSLNQLSLGTYTLTEKWQPPFEVDLSYIPEEEFQNVIGGFAWIISWADNDIQVNKEGKGPKAPRTFVIEIRNIRYER